MVSLKKRLCGPSIMYNNIVPLVDFFFFKFFACFLLQFNAGGSKGGGPSEHLSFVLVFLS